MTRATTPTALPARPRVRLLWTVAVVVAYVGTAVGANLATDRLGLVPVGLGLTATAGTWLAGLALAARDGVHEAAGRGTVYACIAAGTLGSAITAGPRLALASGAAFAVSETIDMLVYTPLRRRGLLRAVAASNAGGAVVDTLLFLTLAGFTISTAVVGGQLVAKATATAAVIAGLVAIRAVLRHRLRPKGA